MKAMRRMAAVAAAGAMVVGLPGCEPAVPFFTATTSGYQVSNGYRPVVGDFDGDGWDDIIWQEPDRWDAMWEGRPDGRFVHLAAPAQLEGWYEGVVGDFGGDATDDVLWYRSDGEPSPIWIMQAGGGRAEATTVVLPVDAGLATIEETEGHDRLLVSEGNARSAGVWDPDSGTDALTPLGTGDPVVSAPGDFDGDGHGDVFLHRPGAPADEIAWGDGEGGFTVQATTNIGGDYGVFVLQADGLDGDDLAFVDERVGRPWALNLWFSEGDRTFRRQAFTPLPDRGIIRVHRSHGEGFDRLVKYTNGGAYSWDYAPSGVIVSAPTPLPGPGTVPAYVGRFHDGWTDDALVYDDFGDYPTETFLRSPDR